MRTILFSAIISLSLTSCVSSMVTAGTSSQSETITEDVLKHPNKAEPVISKQTLKMTQVPTMVLASVKKKYPSENIRSAAKVTVDGKVYYQFDLQSKRKKGNTVVFNSYAIEETAVPFQI